MTEPARKSKVKKSANHVYITERTRYYKIDVPTVDVLVEAAKLHRKLDHARELGKDPHNMEAWKLEAQALTQLGQLEKWQGHDDAGDAFMTQAARVCRMNTFNKRL
ncbi:hypothetical protein SPRG_02634 [Saprolegnia parasitica CBS 223.65]|uniref:Uncharacterized protein n=1 Tax=Saprolegnia parasitica (strain CBS 223.65) TaxID=695850 RepID=A0A067D2F0_SAPPC|nr:hypothetical protein SPRG_02634 [Saprolegnia parasitica CBS 223.65]KDO32941.1 hypothetical protein SPRG_02634 [Saprolegnia parasitica CBS 223.65]|eukprot:XP_012196588.1 hypothetical protein SPRG_02634 [Saprolegnia parasitica CBS 223.65]